MINSTKTKVMASIIVSLVLLSILCYPLPVKATPVIRFRLLAVERYFDSTRMFEAVDLITELLNYPNWDNSTSDYESYIHLLSAVGDPTTLPTNIQPMYQGNSTKANLESEIKNFLGQAGDEEIVIFYYCGHGGDRLLALDTTVWHTELIPWLSWGGLPGAYVNVILDTCHSGSWINDGSSPGTPLGPGRNVLAACESAQSAWCWGTHTAFTDEGLIPGFGSATDTNTDGWISVEEVFTYAEPKCTSYAAGKGKTQEPVSWYDICTGNIPLVQRDTTKPFPDFAYPTTTLSIGAPKHIAGPTTYVTSATPFTLTAEDLTCPTSDVDFTKYKVDSGSWVTYTGPFTLASILGDGPHTIYYYSKDNAGNEEPQKSLTVILDNTPPDTTLTIGSPQYTDGGDTYVTPATPFTLDAEDNPGSGVASTHYRIHNPTYDSGWLTYSAPFYLTGLTDAQYSIDYYSVDNVGNAETIQTVQVILFSWDYVFVDTFGRGTILKINRAHGFIQFLTPSKDYGIRKATRMTIMGAAINIFHEDAELRLCTTMCNTILDYCRTTAWDKPTGRIYFLLDKLGIE